jgi:hypothetical protein
MDGGLGRGVLASGCERAFFWGVARGETAMFGIYHDNGIRFEYPADWELAVSADGPRTTIELHAPSGLAFAFVTLDDSRPEPEELVDEALEAMRDEYPDLDSQAVEESLDGRDAIGHDLEFFSLDMINSCSIRSYRTERHTVLLFGQCSAIDGEDSLAVFSAVRRSLEEVEDLADRSR